MALSEADVRHVALLSRLQLSDAEIKEYTQQLGKILDYVQMLNELDTTQVQPMLTASASGNVFRPDEPRPGLPRELVFQSAPAHDDEYFRVPPVIE